MNFESYEDAIGQEVSRAQVVREIAAHNASLEQFDAEIGDHLETYLATTILDWLGY